MPRREQRAKKKIRTCNDAGEAHAVNTTAPTTRAPAHSAESRSNTQKRQLATRREPSASAQGRRSTEAFGADGFLQLTHTRTSHFGPTRRFVSPRAWSKVAAREVPRLDSAGEAPLCPRPGSGPSWQRMVRARQRGVPGGTLRPRRSTRRCSGSSAAAPPPPRFLVLE